MTEILENVKENNCREELLGAIAKRYYDEQLAEIIIKSNCKK